MKERVGDNFSQFFPEAAQVVSNKKEITFVLGNSDLIKNPSTATLNPDHLHELNFRIDENQVIQFVCHLASSVIFVIF